MKQVDVASILTLSYLRDFPQSAARDIEQLPAEEVVPVLSQVEPLILAQLWFFLLPDVAEQLLLALSPSLATGLLSQMDPVRAANLLERLPEPQRETLLSSLNQALRNDIKHLLTYPPDAAGRLMDTRVAVLRPEMTTSEALHHLRRHRGWGRIRFLFLVDDDQRAVATVDLQRLVLANPQDSLRSLSTSLNNAISALATRDEVIERLEANHLEELPVVVVNGRLLGVIRSETLRQTLHEASSADMLTMVGVSQEERALSSPLSSARKRILWMHVNLMTAFVAASVVGLFENTIAQFTALAVLMPVVAGMGGNMGSQALAVTLRGLALREITVRHWLRIFFKEIRVGLINGTLIALTTATAVGLFSGNAGLALVIGLAMSISLSIACVAGAMVPIVMTRLGQDPAQASAIFLTTITDITGFMSFLGIATLLSDLLV